MLKLSCSAVALCCFSAAVMGTEGFDYLEETCPSLLSDLLATVAEVDDDLASLDRKRGVCVLAPVESAEATERRTRRRL